MMGPVFDYNQYGESGQWVSSLMPGLSSVIDDVCVIRSMHTDQFNHSPAQLLLQTGNPLLGYPSMGSWVTYGLGSDCLLYTSDAADDSLRVDLGGRRIIKKS